MGVTVSWHMPDESKLRRQVLLRLAGNPWVLAPALAGASMALGTFALNAQTGVGLFALCAGILGSVGALFTKALLGGPELRAAVERELQDADRRDHESRLDQLDRTLSNIDHDPRPEASLRDLRALRASFEELAARPSHANSMLSTEVISQIRMLAERGVASLRQTIDLQTTVGRLNSPAAAAPLLAERERLIREVQATVQQLGLALAALQTTGADAAAPELRRLRNELDASLQAARRAEERLEEMLRPAVPELPTPS